jgi:hypothetical protein
MRPSWATTNPHTAMPAVFKQKAGGALGWIPAKSMPE